MSTALARLERISYEQFLSDVVTAMEGQPLEAAPQAMEPKPEPVTLAQIKEAFVALEDEDEDKADDTLEEFGLRRLKQLKEEDYERFFAAIATKPIEKVTAHVEEVAGLNKTQMAALYKEAKEENASQAKAVIGEFGVTAIAKVALSDYKDVEEGLREILEVEEVDTSELDDEEGEDPIITAKLLLEVVEEGFASEYEEEVRKVVKGFGFKTKKPTIEQARKMDEADRGDCYDDVLEIIQPDQD